MVSDRAGETKRDFSSLTNKEISDLATRQFRELPFGDKLALIEEIRKRQSPGLGGVEYRLREGAERVEHAGA